MEILVKRTTKTSNSTIGELYINGKFFCHTLEDVDRGLDSKMPLQEILRKKIKKETAIPTGKYEVGLTFSNKYQQIMPEIINVPGYVGIRIHPGNHKDHTEGCLLVGEIAGKDAIKNSRSTFRALFSLMKEAIKKEKIFIEII